MATSVASYTEIDSGWFSTTTPRSISGLSWSAGDIIVIIGGSENDVTTLSNPTNANLTIGAPKADGGSPAGVECTSYVWVSDPAAGAQTGQAIVCAASGGQQWGCAAWVITGGPTGFANATTNITESAISRTVSAGSIVCYGLFDFNATNPPGKTPLAGGGGTTTERLDQGNGSTYAQWMYDEVGTSAGTFNFGPSDYTSLRVSQVIVEILPTEPLSVALTGQVASWFTTGSNGATKTITTRDGGGDISWSAGDIIVIKSGSEKMDDIGFDLVSSVQPSNANLSFGAPVAFSGGVDSSECGIWIYVATAGSDQSGQTITITLNKDAGGTQLFAFGARMTVWSGASGTANATANMNESSISRTVSAGSGIDYGLLDWNATNPPGKTPLAGGGGTTTERLDQGNGTNYAQWMYDEVGTSTGTFNFGPNNYTSLKVAQAIIEVLATAAVPTNLQAQGGLPGVVYLTWTAPGGFTITGYEVDYALASAPTSWLGTESTGSTNTEFLKAGLTNGIAYVFRVRALDAGAGSGWSETSASATPDGSEIKLWNIGRRRI